MNLRTIAAAGTLAAICGMPAVSHATTPVQCDSLTSRNTSSDPGAAPTRAGVCLQGGGYIEAGTDGTHVYVVASSDNAGYIGVSSYSSTQDSEPCGPSSPDGSEGGSGSNSGGCYGTNSFQVNVGSLDPTGLVPLPVCGDDTGPWYNTSRNGCRIDNEDVDQGVAQALAVLACLNGDVLALPECVL